MMHSNQQPPVGAHRRLVQSVFDAAAPRYDLMNDLMTLGLHRPLKRLMVDMAGIRPHHRVLDVASGTGDLVALVRPLLNNEAGGAVIALDANPQMLRRGRDRLLDKGICDVPMLCAQAENLPIQDAAFDRVLLGFGLRNFSEPQRALAEICRCLRPGGRLLVLELSQPTSAHLRRLYDAVSDRALPGLGALVAGTSQPYRYLHDSIRRHPPAGEVAQQIRRAGFAECRYWRLLGGIFCLHRAEKG